MNQLLPFNEWARLRGEAELLTESGFARVRRIMFGDVPKVQTIGIVTAQNPYGGPPWPGNDIESGRENRDRNQSLEQYLRTKNFGPIKVKGRFGLYEDSFLIPNITKAELVNIGRQYDQESVIWGQKEIDQYNNPYFRFEYIENGQTQSIRSVHLGGRKFIIPFFDDDPHARKVPGKKYGTVADVPDTPATPWTADELANKVRKAETFVIPFFDDPSTEMIFDARVNEMTYYSGRLPDNPVVRQLVEEIQRNTEALFVEHETTIAQTESGSSVKTFAPLAEKAAWHHRGIVRECLAGLRFNRFRIV